MGRTISDLLKDRPVYNGLPVPFTTLIVDGKPDFKMTDIQHWFECACGDLCAICGRYLDFYVWYIGSERQANEGWYFDLAMHEECCFFAASTCPFIAHGTGYKPDESVKAPEGYTIEMHASSTFLHRPEVMVASKRRRGDHRMDRQGAGWFVQVGKEYDRQRVGV